MVDFWVAAAVRGKADQAVPPTPSAETVDTAAVVAEQVAL